MGSSNRFTTEQIIPKIVATIGPDIPRVIAESWIDTGRK